MTFRSDAWGAAFRASDWKMTDSTWGMHLSQLHRQNGLVRIATYSLPNIEYVATQFDRRPWGIRLLCHSKFIDRARFIAARYPRVDIRHRADMHAKLLLIEPQTLWIGSANFGSSKWVELMVGIHSKPGHAEAARTFDWLWDQAKPVVQPVS